MQLTRREALSAVMGSTAAAALIGADSAKGDEPKKAPDARPAQHSAVALPFDPKKLKGVSEKLIVSHWENNYGGAVKNLNKVEDELSRVTKDTPGFLVAGLRDRELTFTNSVILHELYFGNLGGDGKAAGAIQAALADSFGGLARWEELFRATGASLAGGSGWVVLDWNFHTGNLRTYGSGGHTQMLAFGAPLLVMDMYEHAYQMDFGAGAAKYIDAFFGNIQWGEVNARFERARKAAAVLHPGA